MKTAEIRKKFIEFFVQNGHTAVESAPIVPFDDPTLLFINAGMNRFKKIFLGQDKESYTRAVSSQKCLRVGGKHNDLDQVGHTARHLTFFEMLGNFSFGDYFKKEAIELAYKLSVEGFGIDTDRLWITVYETDDEAQDLWRSFVKPERIVPMGKETNFWSMGPTGPCGPCSELFYDLGPEYGDAKSVLEDTEETRYFEFWNLVFMQYNQEESGKQTALPHPSIDTGMGLERMAMLQQKADSVFGIDLFCHIIDAIKHKTSVSYEGASKDAYHVIADHLRAVSFAIADGVMPGNVERGYVLRKIIRRAVRYARQLKIEKPLLADLLPTLIETMGESYPELQKNQDLIARTVTTEEENFFRTLRRGGNILTNIIKDAKDNKEQQISGKDAFTLKDTYGFPLEEIILLANDNSLSVNLDAYQILEEKAKEMSKKAHTTHKETVSKDIYSEFVTKHGATTFTGYDTVKDRGTITGILHEGEWVEKLEEGQTGSIVLDQTSFYAEMGGQAGDTGELVHDSADFIVTDCVTPYPGVVLHKGEVKRGTLIMGEPVETIVQPVYRRDIRANHTAVHLLHWALTKILGEHVRPAGSFVGNKGFRLDFSHPTQVTQKELHEIEQLLNEQIVKGLVVNTEEVPFEEVKNRKEIKQLFQEKYGDVVRVVSIGDVSYELCGGTHAESLDELMFLRITGETSVGSGIRRIEAVTRSFALDYMYKREGILQECADKYSVRPVQLPQTIDKQINTMKTQHKELQDFRNKHLDSLVTELCNTAQKVDDVSVIAQEVEIETADLIGLSNRILKRTPRCVLCLAIRMGKACHVLVRVSPELIDSGFSAKEILQEFSDLIAAKGGGNPEMAQMRGQNAEGIPALFEQLQKKICQPQ